MPMPLFIARQGRRPSGLFGRVVAAVMERQTAGDNDRAIALLAPRNSDTVLDVGCGHGRSLRRIANLAPSAKLIGADFSDVMLTRAQRKCANLIAQGRLTLHKANADALPLKDESVDKALTVNTIYFWHPADGPLGEIARVLKPGGRFVLGCMPAEDTRMLAAFPPSIYHLRRYSETLALLDSAGLRLIDHQSRDIAGRSMQWFVAEKPE